MTPSREHAEMLLRKAAQDEFVMDKLLSDPTSPEEMIGFHAQQAVEKMTKAVLGLHSIAYRRTHDLVELTDLLRANDIQFPEELEDARRLGPFATVFRYDELLARPNEPFDRSWAAACVRVIREWSSSLIARES